MDLLELTEMCAIGLFFSLMLYHQYQLKREIDRVGENWDK